MEESPLDKSEPVQLEMNTKPLKDWTYDELMAECAWLIIEAITKGEPLKAVMYTVDNLTTGWRKEVGIKL